MVNDTKHYSLKIVTCIRTAKTLGEDTKKTDIQVIRAELNALYKEKRELESKLGV